MTWTAFPTWVVGQVSTASDWNTYVANNMQFIYNQGSWVTPVFTNSWVNYNPALSQAGYRLVQNIVYLRGTLAGSTGTSAFTLPAGFTPTLETTFPASVNTGFAYLDIKANGQCIPNYTGGPSYLAIDGISFFIN